MARLGFPIYSKVFSISFFELGSIFLSWVFKLWNLKLWVEGVEADVFLIQARHWVPFRRSFHKGLEIWRTSMSRVWRMTSVLRIPSMKEPTNYPICQSYCLCSLCDGHRNSYFQVWASFLRGILKEVEPGGMNPNFMKRQSEDEPEFGLCFLILGERGLWSRFACLQHFPPS